MKRIALVALAAAIMVSLPACNRTQTYAANGMTATVNEDSSKNSNVTRENADRLELGMSESDVVAVLGNPFYSSEQMIDGKNIKLAVWQNDQANVSVTFENGKVQAKIATFQ